jgi:hypothetical protein
MFVWRKKSGIDIFTGVLFVNEPNNPTDWTECGQPNCYKLQDKYDIDGPRSYLSMEEFMEEMQQYD